MFHKAIDLKFNKGTELEVTFQDGKVKTYDMSKLFARYPQLEALKDRKLFLSGKLMGSYGIVWNDDLDIETESIYEEGFTVKEITPPQNIVIGEALMKARSNANLSQSELSKIAGIDQSDISKIERGVANPSVSTLKRLASAMGMELNISFDTKPLEYV